MVKTFCALFPRRLSRSNADNILARHNERTLDLPTLDEMKLLAVIKLNLAINLPKRMNTLFLKLIIT